MVRPASDAGGCLLRPEVVLRAGSGEEIQGIDRVLHRASLGDPVAPDG